MNKFRLETSEREVMGQVQYFAVMYRMTPKGRFNEAIEFNYRFKTAAARQAYIDGFYSREEQKYARSEERKQAKKEARKNMVNPYKVGDLLYNSWGYDQTNIDFYQVVAVGAKSVKIRPIASAYVKEGYCSMSEFVAPVPDAFTGEAETKVLQMYVAYATGEPVVYIPMKHGCMSRYEGTPKYQSHYA